MARHRRLTPSEARFAKYYAKTGNASDSARRAGYSPNGANVAASRLLKRDRVQVEIARLVTSDTAAAPPVTTEAAEAVVNSYEGASASITGQIMDEMSEQIAGQLTRDWVTAQLIRNVRMAMGDLPVKQSRIQTKREKDGRVTYQVATIETYVRDAAAVVSSMKLLLDESDRREKAEAARTVEASADGGEMSLGARLLIKAFGPIPKRNRDAVELDEDPDELGPDYSDDSSDPERR